MSQTVQIGRFTVNRRYLESMKTELLLYKTRKARLHILRTKYADKDPVDYHSYRSPQVGGQPGAPGHVGDPTGERVVALIETQEMAHLETWLDAVEMVLNERLSQFQRFVIEEWVMVPPGRRTKTFGGTIAGHGVSEREGFYRLNEALLEFALVLVGESKVLCSKPAVVSL